MAESSPPTNQRSNPAPLPTNFGRVTDALPVAFRRVGDFQNVYPGPSPRVCVDVPIVTLEEIVICAHCRGASETGMIQHLDLVQLCAGKNGIQRQRRVHTVAPIATASPRVHAIPSLISAVKDVERHIVRIARTERIRDGVLLLVQHEQVLQQQNWRVRGCGSIGIDVT